MPRDLTVPMYQARASALRVCGTVLQRGNPGGTIPRWGHGGRRIGLAQATGTGPAGDVAETQVGDIPRVTVVSWFPPRGARQRELFAVRPRTMPTKASTSGVVRSAIQARATDDAGPPRSGRYATSRRW